MTDHSQNIEIGITANTENTQPNERLANLQFDYQKLLEKYFPYENYPDAKKVDSTSLNKDIAQLMDFCDKYQQTSKDHSSIQPSLAEVFLPHSRYFNALNFSNFQKLINRNKIARQTASSVLEKEACFTKEKLKNRITYMKAKQELSPTKTENADHDFFFFLLLIEKHAKFFNWNEIAAFFTMIDGTLSTHAYRLTLKFEHIKKSWQTFLNTLEPESATSYILGMAKLKDKELNELFPTQNDKDNLFCLLEGNAELVNTLVDGWSQGGALSWFIAELPKKTESAYTSNINAILGFLLEALMASKSGKMNVLIPKYLDNKYVVANIPEKSLKKCLEHSEQATQRQQTLIQALAKDQNRFISSKHSFMHLVLTAANASSTKELMKNKCFQVHLSSKEAALSHTYQLILQINDKQKLKNLSGEHLKCLTSRELLKLATHPKSEEIFPLKMLEKTLNLRPHNFKHTSKEQSDLNKEMSIAIQQNKVGSHIGVFYTLMSHGDYQEAWLRKQIFDPKWNKLGWGLFSMKVPTTIAKARQFLTDPKTGTTPLSQDNLQTLFDMFRQAQQKSYKYPTFRGEVDFRDKETQKLYDQIIKFGGSEIIEPEVTVGNHLL